MIGRYFGLVFSRAAQLVWKALVNYPVPAVIGAFVYYPIVYYITWRASTADKARWADAVLDLQTAGEAFAWSVAAVFLIAVFFLAPYQLWKEAQGRALANEAGLAAIGEERPLLFTGVTFGWEWLETDEDEGPALTSITLKHDNRGGRHLRYSIENVWVEVLARRIELLTVQRNVIIAPYVGGTFQFVLPDSVRVDDFPQAMRVNADYFYDTERPTRVRQSGSTTRYVLYGWKVEDRVDGMWFDDQREE